MRERVSESASTIEQAVTRRRSGEGSMRDFVEIVFDSGGASNPLVAMAGKTDKLAPVDEAVRM